MQYTIDNEICSRFPNFQRGVVVAKNIDNSRSSPELARSVSEAATLVANSIDDSSDPRLEAWDQAYRAFGANPTKDTPSIRFLISQIRKGKTVRSISPLVDAFNLTSLKYVMPCGGDDLDTLAGNIHLGVAKGTELFSSLFRPEASEHPIAGEVIYHTPADGRVLCRRWNWRNSHFSRIRPETRNVAVNIDAMLPAIDYAVLERATRDLAVIIQRFCGGQITTHLLDPSNSSFMI